ncbi:MAG: glycosyltransferase family 4 protein [Bacteroidales bacterium]|nr:glycosyltransferase family 4 protein [Bacteroidales bacterium]
MKVLLINKDFSGGGAAVAFKRLFNALKKSGEADVSALVQHHRGEVDGLYPLLQFYGKHRALFNLAIEKALFLPYERSKAERFAFSSAIYGNSITRHELVKKADIIHIHWINQGFLPLSEIKKLSLTGKPIVWTMHDMWNFTGGCHYAGNCSAFIASCGNCPFLKRPSETDLSARLFQNKMQLFSRPGFIFVGCSKWLAAEAAGSKILGESEILSIPNPIDTDFYKPGNKIQAREYFRLPHNKKIILFGAAKLTDKRKGLEYLLQAVKRLKEMGKTDYLLVTFGAGGTHVNFPMDNISVPYLHEEKEIAMLYNAADIFVVPSLEDNLPNTIMESLSCGTPVAAFNTGGIPEMIEHKVTGYLARPKDADNLATGIEWLLENANSVKLSEAARNKAIIEYSEKVVAQRYIRLYSDILSKC